jgi:hypothetical protein
MPSTPKVFLQDRYLKFIDQLTQQPTLIPTIKEPEVNHPHNRHYSTTPVVDLPHAKHHSKSISINGGGFSDSNISARLNGPKNARNPIDEFKEGFDMALIDLETENMRLKSSNIEAILKQLKELKKKLA